MAYMEMQQGKITGGFWHEKQEQFISVTLNEVYRRFEETGRIATMACTAKAAEKTPPHPFWGSDVFKWLESAAYALMRKRDDALEAKCDRIIDNVCTAQQPDGYYNSYYLSVCPEKRFTDRNKHELYSLGHMVEAAVAYYEATGKKALLDAAEKNMHLVDRIFRVENSAPFITPGHEEIELALCRLFRLTGKREYLELALYFVNQRGCNAKDLPVYPTFGPAYEQCACPVRQMEKPEGHAVRALYLYCAMADLAVETRDGELAETCKKLFFKIENEYMYLTGGVGQTREGEAFTLPYHLPSDTAYCETCACVALCMFALRMQRLESSADYADVVERALYNGVLSGVSAKGEAFFYENPLTRDLAAPYSGEKERQRVFSCSCCPPNITRLIGNVGAYVYGFSENRVYVHQFMESEAAFEGAYVSQKTDYPISGRVTVTASCPMAVRVPGWCRSFSANAPYKMHRGYALFDAGEVTVDFHMTPYFVKATPRAHDLCGRVALTYGPLVYCCEEIDQPGNVFALTVAAGATPQKTVLPFTSLPGFRVSGVLEEYSPALYTPAEESCTPAMVSFIPFCLCQNRGKTAMQVWMNRL